MSKYESYLEKVRDQNNDEYQELGDILARYWTLKNSNTNLQNQLSRLETSLESLKNEILLYEKEKNAEIMGINNDIANLQTKFEK